MLLEEINIIISIVLSVLSFLLAAISVITVILSLKQNGKMIKLGNDQLTEMRKEHELSLQPVLSFIIPKFVIEKPRLFYTPPEDEYSISSRFGIRTEINNVSSAVAINIVCSATGFVKTENEIKNEDTASKRINILSGNTEFLEFLMLESELGTVFDSLRERNVDLLPQIEINAVFKNTIGGTFRMKKRFVVCPKNEELEEIRKWHSIVASAKTDYKEELKVLHNSSKEKKEALFEELKNEIDERGGENKEILLGCIELDEFFIYESISNDEYNDVIKKAHFGRLIGIRSK